MRQSANLQRTKIAEDVKLALAFFAGTIFTVMLEFRVPSPFFETYILNVCFEEGGRDPEFPHPRYESFLQTEGSYTPDITTKFQRSLP